MNAWFARLPLHRKLVASALLITGVALLVATLGLSAFDVWRYRATALEDAAAVASALAENTAAAVAFRDDAQATETLRSVRVRDVITRACIFLPDGSLFAGFSAAASGCPSSLSDQVAWNGVLGSAAITRNDREYGSLYVERSLADLRDRLLLTTLAGLSMFVLAASAAFVLAQRVHRTTSEPVSALAQFARTFGSDPHRAPPAITTAPDEIGELVRSFGEMVTRIRTTNEELERQSTQLRLITDAIPALISYVDDECRYRFNNKAYEDWFGHSRAEVHGRHLEEVLGDAAFARLRPYVDAALRGERVQYETEVPYQHGGTRHIRADYVPDIRPDGRVIGYFALVTDITDRKRAEEALREADRRKDEFLAILAHELRNPLAPIRTGLELLRVGGDSPGTVQRIQPLLERQVGHMVRLIDDLLDISRITSGRIHLQRHPTPLAEMVHSAVETNRSAIEAAGLHLAVEMPDRACVLDVDATRFVQVLSNILHNSTKFTEHGGRIAIDASLDESVTPPLLTLNISDTGIGIAPVMLPRVFDLFVQGDTTHRVKAGLGIGLALARQLVEMQGGQIEARSEGAGRGTTVTIRMPASVGKPSVEGVAQHEAVDASGRRVLIVDDNIDAAETTAALVLALGGEARTAFDGASGLERAAEFLPDAILLDIGMPGMDGYETCRLLRQQPSGRRAYIVALTGWGQPQDRERALRDGFDAHLTKPADPRRLATILAAIPISREGSTPLG